MRYLDKILENTKHFDLSGFRDNNHSRETERKEDKVEFNGEMYILENGILVGSMNRERQEASGTENICTLLLGMSSNNENILQFWEMQPFVIAMRYPTLYEVNLKSEIRDTLKFQGKYLGFGYELENYHAMLSDITEIELAGEYMKYSMSPKKKEAYQTLAQIDLNRLKVHFEKSLMHHTNQVGKSCEINLNQK